MEKPSNDDLLFGKHYTDHMLEVDWTEASGWQTPVIRPLEPLKVHPAAKVFHYAAGLFEGMKVFRGVDNNIRMFRPMENMNRMAESAKRAGFPEFDKEEMLKCLKKLVEVDQDWTPYSENSSLYIRPTCIGTEPTLGLTYPREAKLFAILCPTGPYFPSGIKAITLLADPRYVRAWPGGSGQVKMGSNYAPAMAVQKEANKLGCSQVLWLYGSEGEITEAGTMNLFVYWINENGVEELITPPLHSGLILPGITRKSLLEMARGWGEFKVSEKKITMAQFRKALREGRVKEMFGTGTACLICPINKIVSCPLGETLVINESDEPQPLTQRIFKEFTDIQYYQKPSAWMESL